MKFLKVIPYAAALLFLALPADAEASVRSRYFRAFQDSVTALAQQPPQDSLQSAPLDSAALAALQDSLRLSALYDSLDKIFWKEIDTVSLPQIDSFTTAFFDSIALRLPDSSDIKRIKKKIEKEERDSIKASIPRVLETFAFPESLYFKRIIVWTSDSKFNECHLSGLDTTADENFYDYPMFKKDVNASYLGPVGSAALYHNYFKREEIKDAPMFTPYIGDSQTGETIKQYNTKTPYTELAYWGTLFSIKSMEEGELHLMSTQNISPAFNFTLSYDRLGSEGMLKNESTNHRNTAIIANYLGKRYLMNAGTIRQTINRKENGGIRDSYWIRDTVIDTKAIEVNLQQAANTYKRRSYFIHQSLAVPMNFLRKDRDSLALGEGTMAHIGHSGEFTTYNKVYEDAIADEYGRSFYNGNFFLNPSQSYDELSVRNFENKFFIKLQPFAPDALLSKINAGIGYQVLSTYSFSPSDYLSGKKYDSQHNLYIYGGASGQLKKYIAWDADADYYYAGTKMFDFDINGKLRLSVYPIDQGIHLTGRFSTSLDTPHPFEQHLYMNHHQWDNDFSKVSRTKIEGSLTIPKWKLEAYFGYALSANTIYYDSLSVVRQCPEAISIMSAYLRKDIKLWRFHFDNKALFQLCSNEEVIPLPKLSFNLRYYIDLDVVKNVMNMQIGLNALFHTSYYAPGFKPDIGQFYNQTKEQIGNVPYFDAFVNMQWKRASIFVKYTNCFKDWPSSDYFSTYQYIRPARGFKFGIMWPFYTW